MIITLVNWTWAFTSFFLTGMLVKKFIGTVSGWCPKKGDEIIVSGIIFCTVYSQTFSLFYKVGVLCTLTLVLIDAVALVICRKDIIKSIKRFSHPGIPMWRGFVCLVFGFFFLMAATLKVEHVDSYLYHAQAIEWNELYGAVKGLGNLHARLAYNSSFFCLQALFSLRGLMGRSLHVLNGLFCFLASAYSFGTMKIFDTKRVCASDLVRMITFFYVLYTVGYISSPCSDILTLLILIYVMTRWTEAAEEGRDDRLQNTAFLGVITVYLVTLKLSALPFVMLCLYPLYIFVKERKWRGMITMLLSGTLVIAPFFARNIIQSGYLLYPFPGIDLFSFDWKIPAQKAAYESKEIMAWGRGMTDKELYDSGFSVWIHRWWQLLDSEYKLYILIDLAAIVFDISVLIGSIKKKYMDAGMFLVVVTVVAWSYWLFTAPIIRYGMPLVVLVPAVSMMYTDKGMRACFAGLTGIFIAVMLFNLVSTYDTYNCKIIFPEDYPLNEGRENEILSADGKEFIIYTPVKGANLSEYPIYHQFPAVPLKSNIKETEMRGKDFSDGFRYKSITGE